MHRRYEGCCWKSEGTLVLNMLAPVTGARFAVIRSPREELDKLFGDPPQAAVFKDVVVPKPAHECESWSVEWIYGLVSFKHR